MWEAVLPGKTFEVGDSSRTVSGLFAFPQRVEKALDGLLDVGNVVVLCSVDARARSHEHAHDGRRTQLREDISSQEALQQGRA